MRIASLDHPLAGVAVLLLGLVLLLVTLWLARAWLLRRPSSADWSITWDLAEPLQFAAYVGSQTGLPDAAAPVLARDWRWWWQQLVDDTFRYEAGLDATLRASTDVAPATLARLIAQPAALRYDPPDFDTLAERPALQQHCRQHWPDFQTRWALEKPALLAKMRRQGRQVREERIVRAAARAAGLAEAAPFFLRLDFVRWLEAAPQTRSAQHLVLGTHYLEPASAPALEALLAEAVRQLI